MITSSSNQITQVNLTRTITLFCDFQSSPLARSLAWRWNNKPITNLRHAASNTTILTSSQHTKQRLQLTITNATRFDYGVFECEASNDVGSVKRNITLVVNCECIQPDQINFAKFSLTIAIYYRQEIDEKKSKLLFWSSFQFGIEKLQANLSQ